MLSLILSASAMDDAAQKSEQLQELKRDMDRVKRERSTILTKERNILVELRDIEKKLTAKERELHIYELNLSRCERDIKQLEEALAGAELRSKQTQALMMKRLRAMYKFGYEGGQLSYLKLLLGAENISDLTSKYKYISAIANGDRKLLEKAIAEKAEIDLRKERVEARKKRILYYKAGAERIKKEILNKRRIRQDTLAELQESKGYLTKVLNELEKSVEELENRVGFGQMVILDHGNGYRTLYAHASELLVREKERVEKGKIIAKVGDTGSLKGPVLYFEIWKGIKAMHTRQWLR